MKLRFLISFLLSGVCSMAQLAPVGPASPLTVSSGGLLNSNYVGGSGFIAQAGQTFDFTQAKINLPTTTTGVNSVGGTANEIWVNGGTPAQGGNVVLSLPSTLIFPGSLASLPATTVNLGQSVGSIPFGLSVPQVGLVTLADGGVGALSAGAYTIGVKAVDSNGGEGIYDEQGGTQSNTITISGSHCIGVSWPAVSGAASYRVYVKGPGASFYQRYYSTASTSLTINVQPAGAVQSLTISGSTTGGFLTAGDYYFSVDAVWSNGTTSDQTLTTAPVYKHYLVTTNTGSVAVSWASTDPYGNSFVGITGYRVFVITTENGSPRTHTQYFTVGPSVTSYTVLGTETLTTGPQALLNAGTDGGYSNAAVVAGILSCTNTKSFFAADINISSFYENDASFQSNRYSDGGGFSGSDFRSASVLYWRFGLASGDSSDNITLYDSLNGTLAETVTLGTEAVAFTGPLTSGGLSVIGNPTVVFGPSSANLVLGGTPISNGSDTINLTGSNSVKNWQIATNNISAGDFEITPSTANGGSTFTTPTIKLVGATTAVNGTLSVSGTTTLAAVNTGLIGATAIGSTGAINSTSATSGIGYATGSGGTVTQTSSRTTGVTLNTVTGAITLVSAAGSASPASFTVTDSAVAAADGVVVQEASGTDLYEIFVTAIGGGSFKVTYFTTGGTTTEQPVFKFSVIKGANS